jgi:hypothetical protein
MKKRGTVRRQQRRSKSSTRRSSSVRTRRRITASKSRGKRRQQRGGALGDICGICPVCDSEVTERYATGPDGSKIYCTCENGHIYSPESSSENI